MVAQDFDRNSKTAKSKHSVEGRPFCTTPHQAIETLSFPDVLQVQSEYQLRLKFADSVCVSVDEFVN